MEPDNDDARSPSVRTVSVDAIPDPLVGYDVRDGGPEIAVVNDAFGDAFDVVAERQTVRRLLRTAFAADGSTIDDVCSSLATGDPVDIELKSAAESVPGSNPERYRLRTLREMGADGSLDGYCLLTELGGEPRRDSGVEIDRIASVLSHDLRNPLDVANAHLRAARETGEEEHFDHVRESHDRMAGIIQDVLTLARGRRTLDTVADVDVGSVAADAWATVDTGQASMAVADDLPAVEADPDRLRRLFENLFRNSVEHGRPRAERGTGDDSNRPLQVRVGHADDGFYVADDGVGIPPGERDRVFEPGYSAGEAESGTGLGLTIVSEIADAHGWTVTLSSGPLDGARFEFDVSPEEG